MGNSSLGSLGANERSFDDVTKEAVTAMILNQSNESCCCSDDEFAQLLVGTSKANTIELSPKTKMSKNPRRLQHNGL